MMMIFELKKQAQRKKNWICVWYNYSTDINAHKFMHLKNVHKCHNPNTPAQEL